MAKHSRGHLVVVSVALSLALIACSDSDSDSAPEVVRADQTDSTGDVQVDDTEAPSTEPNTPDGVCGLLTKEEVETELGRTVEDGVEDSVSNDEEVPRCTWTVTMPPPDPELSDDLKATVIIVPMTDIDRAELDGLAANPENIVVDGLGELAVINNNILPGPMYVVLNDEEYLEVDLANFRTPADFPNEERIVEILTEFSTLAVSRL